MADIDSILVDGTAVSKANLRNYLAEREFSSFPSVETIDGLKALLKANLTNGDFYYVSGYYATGEGGGGLFEWVSASTATDDGGLVISSDEGGTGRWLRTLAQPTLSPVQFGAVRDGATDDSAAFAGAATGAGTNGAIAVPPGAFRTDTATLPLTGQKWSGGNSLVQSDAGTGAVFNIASATDWGIEGFRLTGSLVTPVAAINYTDPESTGTGAETETGLKIGDSARGVVSDMTFSIFKKYGVHRYASAYSYSAGGRGQRTIFKGLGFYGNTIGFKNDATNGANEYDIVIGCNASENRIGFDISAGNTILCAVNSVDNDTNIRLRDGTNHGHGIVAASQLSHVADGGDYLVHASDLTNGYTFGLNHLYANSNAGIGPIYLENCGGVNFIGGIIDAWTYVRDQEFDAAATYPYNHQDNVYLPGSYGSAKVLSQGGGTGAKRLIRRNCFGEGLIEAGITTNDPADLYVLATQQTTGPAIVNGDILKFPTVGAIGDRRVAYATGTGLVTIPKWMDGLYEYTARFIISGTGLTVANSYFELVVNGTPACPPTLPQEYSATLWVVEIPPTHLNLVYNDTIGIKATAVNGTTKTFGSATWPSQFTLRKLA